MKATYDLNGLSTGSFERLVQALATKVIAPGVSIFGRGPDGGREATYTGQMNFPSAAAPWDGYLIVQAKFLETSGDASHDAKWAAAELKKELAKFQAHLASRRPPEYYVFATNAVLSPVEGSGGHDKLEEILKQASPALSLRGWQIWGRDELIAHLDAQGDIRQRYAGFITTGDVLAAVIAALPPFAKDMERALARFLSHELRNDLYADLDQARNIGAHHPQLASVFIDLPVAIPAQVRVKPQAEEYLLKLLLSEGRSRFDARGPEEHAADTVSDTPPLGRYVLVGGPGQGKTTTGKFLCQLYRAALLNERTRRLGPEEKEALQDFVRQAALEKLRLPTVRRFPVWVSLSKYAERLAAKQAQSSPAEFSGTITLLQHISDLIQAHADMDVSADDLRRWLATYPWLLVLDGLDEVPANSNRAGVLTEIQRFLGESAECGADIMIVATTRPQGYNEEFSPRYYQHVHLAQLPVKTALSYARKLADAKHGNGTDRASALMQVLTRASREDSIARLMGSPLQTTILYTIVEQGGDPPRQRWKLFSEYYDTIYRREQNKGTPSAGLLNRFREEIYEIHQRVGLHLQTEAEQAGHTDASISDAKFKHITTSVLSTAISDAREISRVSDELLTAASDRLVFITVRSSRTTEATPQRRHGFEIRSLQEFMAAAALLSDRDELKIARLEAIAPFAYWRNVFLFAAGGIYAEHLYLRDFLDRLCRTLNTETPHSLVRGGSSLALDLLLEGAAGEKPKYEELLLRTALELLDTATAEEHQRLASAYLPRHELQFREALNLRISGSFATARGAWAVLLWLVAQKVPFAEGMASAHWPSSPTETEALLQSMPDGAWDWALSKRNAFHIRASAKAACELPRVRSEYEARQGGAGWSISAKAFGQGEFFSLQVGSVGPDSNRRRNVDELAASGPRGPGWSSSGIAARFTANPSRHLLATTLRSLAASEDDLGAYPRWIGLAFCPWPLMALLPDSKTNSELVKLSELAEQGAFGDIDDWLSAETRWRGQGVSMEDLRHSSTLTYGIGPGIGRIGFPFRCAGASVTGAGAEQFAFGELWTKARSFATTPDTELLRSHLAWAGLLHAGGRHRPKYGSELVVEAATETSPPTSASALLRASENYATTPEDRIRLLDTLASAAGSIYVEGEPDLTGTLRNATWAWHHSAQTCPGVVRMLGECSALIPIEGAFAPDPSLIDHPDPRISTGAILLTLASRATGPELAKPLALRAHALLADDPGIVLRAARVATQNSSAVSAPFFETLLELLPAEATEERIAACRGLGHALRRRSSSLRHEHNWRTLSLPGSPPGT